MRSLKSLGAGAAAGSIVGFCLAVFLAVVSASGSLKDNRSFYEQVKGTDSAEKSRALTFVEQFAPPMGLVVLGASIGMGVAWFFGPKRGEDNIPFEEQVQGYLMLMGVGAVLLVVGGAILTLLLVFVGILVSGVRGLL